MDIERYFKDLAELVNMDSFSRYPEGTAQVAAWIKNRLERAGWKTELISIGKEVGPCLKAVWGSPDQYDVLLLGHMDTVFPQGEAKSGRFLWKGNCLKDPVLRI